MHCCTLSFNYMLSLYALSFFYMLGIYSDVKQNPLIILYIISRPKSVCIHINSSKPIFCSALDIIDSLALKNNWRVNER